MGKEPSSEKQGQEKILVWLIMIGEEREGKAQRSGTRPRRGGIGIPLGKEREVLFLERTRTITPERDGGELTTGKREERALQ